MGLCCQFQKTAVTVIAPHPTESGCGASKSSSMAKCSSTFKRAYVGKQNKTQEMSPCYSAGLFPSGYQSELLTSVKNIYT